VTSVCLAATGAVGGVVNDDQELAVLTKNEASQKAGGRQEAESIWKVRKASDPSMATEPSQHLVSRPTPDMARHGVGLGAQVDDPEARRVLDSH
jgi:hypothetical protein